MGRYSTAIIIAATLFSVCSCEKDKEKDLVPIPQAPSEAIVAQNSLEGILEASIDIRSNGILMHIGNVPEGATLVCNLNNKQLDVCNDGALLSRPAHGDHTISIVARKLEKNVAFGEVKFTLLPDGTTNSVDDSKDPLFLIVDSPDFTNGMPIKRSEGYVAKFKFAKKPECEPTLNCRYDTMSSPWKSCDTKNSFSVSKELMANGLQYLSIQAKCGDNLGPILSMFWFGVPDNYEPMLLTSIKDSNSRYILNLARSEDCPAGQQSFKCAAKGSTVFENCEKGNVIDKPTTGYQVRIKCSDKTGPIFTF